MSFRLSIRHMKIHEKDPASGLLPVSPPSPTKRRRPSVKRRQEEENGEEPPSKKVRTLYAWCSFADETVEVVVC